MLRRGRGFWVVCLCWFARQEHIIFGVDVGSVNTATCGVIRNNTALPTDDLIGADAYRLFGLIVRAFCLEAETKRETPIKAQTLTKANKQGYDNQRDDSGDCYGRSIHFKYPF